MGFQYEKDLLTIRKDKEKISGETADCIVNTGFKNKIPSVFEHLCDKQNWYHETDWNLSISKDNYLEYMKDIEIRSMFEAAFFENRELIDTETSFLFLTPVSEQGYNFGQYRIASHLVQLGIKPENIRLFPLHLYNGKYRYSDRKLLGILNNFHPKFVCETVYAGWEKGIEKINRFIKQHSDAVILTGGPLTTSNTEYCIRKLNTDIIFLGHGEYQLEFYLKLIKKTNDLFPEQSIPGMYYIKDGYKKEMQQTMVNRYLDHLYWDMPLLEKFCAFSSVINLFTSEECHGNCVFCYRTSYLKDNRMTKEELLNRLKCLVEYAPFKDKPIRYIRFFEDDFFAASDRDNDLLDRMYDILYPEYKLFELTFSI
jgi:hypothetical protein